MVEAHEVTFLIADFSGRAVVRLTSAGRVDGARSPKVTANQIGYTFATVETTCKSGTHRYRVQTVVYQIHIGDDGTNITTEKYSPAPEFTC